MSDFYERLAKIESGGDPNARAKTSSATGLYQMTRGTFDDLKNKIKGLNNYSWEQHAQDPNIQRQFMEALLARNEKSLVGQGHQVNDLNRYLAHFAGSSGADKLLRSGPDTPIEAVLGKKAAKANNMVGKTVQEVKDFFAKKLGIKSHDEQRSPAPSYPTPDFSNLSASANRPRGGLPTPATSSLSLIPSALGILAQKGGSPAIQTASGAPKGYSAPEERGQTVARSGGLMTFKRGKKVKKPRERKELEEEEKDIDIADLLSRQEAPQASESIPQALPPMQQQAALAQIQAQKQQQSNAMSQLQTQQALQPPPPPAPMPQSPMPPMMPAPIGGPAGQAPVAPPSGPAMAAPAQEVIPIEARLRKSAGLKQLEDDRSTEAAKNALGLRRGGVVGYKDGQTVEGGAPWEDYADSNTTKAAPAESAPWEDYSKSPAAKTPKVTKAGVEGNTFGEKARNFLGHVFSKTADALNTRPEQIVSGGVGSMPVIREKTEEEKQLGPTNAARRAGRTAGFLQGAVVDLPAAIAQISGVGRDVGNEQLEGYKNFRKDLGMGDEWDASRLVGNIASPVGNKAAAVTNNLLSKTGAGLFKKGATQGAIAGIQQPLESEDAQNGIDVLWNKGKQALEGATLGGTLNKIFGKASLPASGGGTGQAGSPVERYRATFPDADLTWGQHLGGRWNTAEQLASSFPFVGNIIREARTKALQSQNVGMMNNALKDAGLKLDRGTQAGRHMFDEAYNKLTGAYDNVLDDVHLPDPQTLRAKIYGKMDAGNGKSLATPDQLADSYTPGVISNKYNQLSEAGQKKFDKILETGLFSKFGKDPKGNHSLGLSGKQFKMHEEDIKDTIDSLMHGGGEDREIGKMLKKSLGEAYDSLQSAKPEVQNQLKKLNKSYAKYKTLESASTTSGASEGIFTPAQTVKAASKGNRGAVARGKGLLQPEAELSEQVMGKAYPDSGTAGRLQGGSLFRDLVGGALSFPFELAYSPKVASTLLQGGTRAKNAIGSTNLGAKVQTGAEKGVPAATRALLGPRSSDISKEEEEEYSPPMARGGLVGYADGGIVNDYLDHKVAQATLAQLAQQQQQPPMGAPQQAAPPPVQGGPKMMAEGGMAIPEEHLGTSAPDSPRLADLWDKYTSYLDKNISSAQKDMENSINFTKEKGLHIKDPEAFKRTIGNMDIAGTFVGPASKLWKATNAEEFLKREGKEAAEALWEKFGTARDPAGNLKQEINDQLANLKAKVLKRNGGTPADQVLEHPELFQSYPELAKARMSLMTGQSTGGQAYTRTDKLTGRETPHIDINRGYYEKRFPNSSQDKLNSTALHEFQHLVQKQEKTPGGGSPSREGAEMAKKLGIKAPKETQMHRDFLQQMIDTAKAEGITGGQLARLEEKLKDANKMVVNDAAKTKAYNRLYGEAESRLTERRRKLSDNQRAMMYPFKHDPKYEYGFDVPVEELITGGYRGLPDMAKYPAAKKARGGLLSAMKSKRR